MDSVVPGVGSQLEAAVRASCAVRNQECAASACHMIPQVPSMAQHAVLAQPPSILSFENTTLGPCIVALSYLHSLLP
jgi:hypothetical protein